MYGSYHLLWIAFLITAHNSTASIAGGQELLHTEPQAAISEVTPLALAPHVAPGGEPLPITAPWGYTSNEQAPAGETLVDPPLTERPRRVTRLHCRSHCTCQTDQEKVYADLFDPQGDYRHPNTFRPHGDAVYSAFGAQVANGHAARMILYQYDFTRSKPTLNQRGYLELLEIAQRLPRTPSPLVIQPSGDADLDAARRATVVAHLNELPFPVPEERVVTAIPQVAGLDGIDAVRVHQRLLRLSATGGSATTGGAAPGTPFGVPGTP